MLRITLTATLLLFTLGLASAQPERMLERMTSELNLTTTQVEQIKALLKDRPSGPPPSSGSSRPAGPPPGGGKFETELKKS